jgi:hypothetical protein
MARRPVRWPASCCAQLERYWRITYVRALLIESLFRPLLFGALLFGSMLFGPLAVSAGGLPSGAIRVEPAAIIDPNGFEQPMVVATLFLPSGWKSQGGVVWGQQFMCTNGYAVNWSATSPDGTTSIAIVPGERWEWNNYGAGVSTPGCAMAPYSSVQQYLAGLVERVRPGARIIDYRVREDLQREFAQLNSYTPMPLGESRTWVEAGEISVEYSEQGRAMRGSIAAVAQLSLMRTNAGNGVMDAFNGATFPGFAASAPKAQFNPAFFEALRRSIKSNPQWERRISGHNLAIAQTALRENQKRSRIIADTNAEISRIRQEAWNNYQESSDRRAREFSEVIRGVETYQDADAPGGQAELSNLYDNAWRLNDGSYVLTNDASFEPYRELGIEGRKLEAAP